MCERLVKGFLNVPPPIAHAEEVIHETVLVRPFENVENVVGGCVQLGKLETCAIHAGVHPSPRQFFGSSHP